MQVTGIVYVKVDSVLLRSKEGASLSFGGKERTAVVGHSVYGPSEKIVPSVVEFTLAHTEDDDLIALHNKKDATIEFITDTGASWLVRNAFSTTPPKLTGGEGDVPFVFNGDPAEPV